MMLVQVGEMQMVVWAPRRLPQADVKGEPSEERAGGGKPPRQT